jgi:tRNA threonylcarbamoyladenosine biosynthesis protein TsaB
MATHDVVKTTKLLAFDTSMDACSVAISVAGKVVAAAHEQMRRGQAERLLTMIEEVSAAAGVSYGDLDYLVTTIGPGSFTGVRVGLAAAKGLALVTHLPIIPLTTTEAIAATLKEPPDGLLSVAIDAKRDQLYLQQFRVREGELETVAAAGLVPLEDLADMQPAEASTVVGSGRQIIAEHWQDVLPLDDEIDIADAAQFIIYGESQIQRAQPAGTILPLYLRAPDAKLPKPK